MVVNKLGQAISLSGQVDSNFRLGPIEFVGIQPTLFCNLNCSYCFVPEEDRRTTKKITLELVEQIAQRIFGSGLVDGPFTVAWAASEPLSVSIDFYEKAFAILEKYNVTKTKIVHSFTTNATLITEDWCHFFAKHDIYLAVSVDGPEFLHDRRRVMRNGEGTHKRVLKGIRLLRKHNIAFATISVLSYDCLDFPDEMYDFFRSEGIRGVSFNFDEADGMNPSSSMNRDDTIERFEEFLSRFYDICQRDDSDIWVREFHGNKAMFTPDEMEKLKNAPMNSMAPNIQFVIPYAMINIDCEGRFSTFTAELLRAKHRKHGDFILGRIQDGPIEDAIHTEKFRDIWSEVAAGVRKCEDSCPQFAFCGGGSPSNKYIENGSCDSTGTLHCQLTTKSRISVVQRKTLGHLQALPEGFAV